MLFICLSCRKIIGCSDGTAKLEHLCDYCENFESCLLETPTDKPVGRQVFFISFKEGCAGHNHKQIGFKIGGKK